MSYTILYKKVSLELSDGRIFPLILMGCNNLTQFFTGYNGRIYERRERSWAPALWFDRSKLFWDKEEYVNGIRQYIANELTFCNERLQPEEKSVTLKNYNYFGLRINSKPATYSAEQSYFVNMTKHTIPVDEFLRVNGMICKVCLKDWSNDKKHKDKERTEVIAISTEDDLIAMDETYQKFYQEAQEYGLSCYCVPLLAENIIIPKKGN